MAVRVGAKQTLTCVRFWFQQQLVLGVVVDRGEIEAVIRKALRGPGPVSQLSIEKWSERFRPRSDEGGDLN